MGSFEMGEGIEAGAQQLAFDDRGFRVVTVPGDTQLQAGFTGVERFRQSAELTAINEKEWWYRKRFRIEEVSRDSVARLVFDGSDYSTTVWVNGQLLGSHEGTYTSFSFDVSHILRAGEENLVAVRVTHPWMVPDGRAFTEYMNGNFSMPPVWSNRGLAAPPYYFSTNWDSLTAHGSAAYAMGIWRSVRLETTPLLSISDMHAETLTIDADGTANLRISATFENADSKTESSILRLRLRPANFSGEAQDIPEATVQASPGESSSSIEVRVPHAQLWWSWDSGPQNLYVLEADLRPEKGSPATSRKITFGIRTVSRDDQMAYHLNGRRIFIRASWFPIEDYYRSTPTKQDYERDLRLFRDANFNLLVNFTVVEKPEFYDLCDRLGILVITELPFEQFGPAQALDRNYPRRDAFLSQVRTQVRQIVTSLRNHPSIVQWSPLAEAHDKESGKWSAGNFVFDQEGYDTFVAQIKSIVEELAPSSVFHPSLCDLGEQHFWMAGSGQYWERGNYQDHFDASTHFVSEYGAVSLSSWQNLGKYLTPTEQWGARLPAAERLFGLPIDVPAYAYWTSFTTEGLYSTLYRSEHMIDRNPRSVRELVDATQLYQAFLLKYATQAYRRKKYDPISGIRSWDFVEVNPGFRFALVDYDRVPKIAYWYMKDALSPVALSFAFKDALESQLIGSRWSAPVWIINDTNQDLSGSAHAALFSVDGREVASADFPVHVNADGKANAGEFSLTLPVTPGVYVLRGTFSCAALDRPVVETSFIKVVPRAFSNTHRVLVIAQGATAGPIEATLQAMGVDADVYDENSLGAPFAALGDGNALHANYGAIWLGNLAGLSKLLPSEAAQALIDAVQMGTGFIVTGGLGSFHGENGDAALIEGSPLSGLLPVLAEGPDDVVWGGHSMDDTLLTQPAIHDIQLAESSQHASPELLEARELLAHYGLPEFNQVRARQGAQDWLTIAGHPLLVTGSYGKGQTVAFSGFTPLSGDSSSLPFDEQLLANPGLRAWFVLVQAMLEHALPGSPSPTPKLLSTREMPLFQWLKELPATQIGTEIKDVEVRNDSSRSFVLRLTNHGGYAHLVSLWADWGKTNENQRPFVEFSANDFEMLPGESRVIRVNWPCAQSAAGAGEYLYVDAANAPAQKLAMCQ